MDTLLLILEDFFSSSEAVTIFLFCVFILLHFLLLFTGQAVRCLSCKGNTRIAKIPEAWGLLYEGYVCSHNSQQVTLSPGRIREWETEPGPMLLQVLQPCSLSPRFLCFFFWNCVWTLFWTESISSVPKTTKRGDCKGCSTDTKGVLGVKLCPQQLSHITVPQPDSESHHVMAYLQGLISLTQQGLLISSVKTCCFLALPWRYSHLAWSAGVRSRSATREQTMMVKFVQS